jgi:hypothetical protein
MRNVTTTVYTFDELSDNAKEKAREWWRSNGLDYEWYDSCIDDIKESEYNYLMSDEVVDDTIRANEYEFNADGSIY